MKTNQEIANEVILGLWGNGEERRDRLTQSGYNYESVQSIVNSIMANKANETPDSTVSETVQNEYLEIDFEPKKYKGLKINILI